MNLYKPFKADAKNTSKIREIGKRTPQEERRENRREGEKASLREKTGKLADKQITQSWGGITIEPRHPMVPASILYSIHLTCLLRTHMYHHLQLIFPSVLSNSLSSTHIHVSTSLCLE